MKRRVELIPSNAALASAEKPAGPVTFAVRPAGRSSPAISRMLSTASISTCSSPPATIGTVSSAAMPSSEYVGGVTKVTPSISAAMIASRRSPTAARVVSSNPAGAL